MSEKPCQKDKLKSKINGGKELHNAIKDEIIAAFPSMAGSGPGSENFDKYVGALAEAISEKVSDGVTKYLNQLTPRLTTPNPQTGQWEQPTFEAIAPQLFSDE